MILNPSWMNVCDKAHTVELTMDDIIYSKTICKYDMKKFLSGFVYAFQGIRISLKEQLNSKVQVVAAIAVVAMAIYFKVTIEEWCILLITMSMVLCLELMNTAIEELVNMVSPERKPQAGRIKDIAAGSVLVASLFSLIIGCIIFIKYIF